MSQPTLEEVLAGIDALSPQAGARCVVRSKKIHQSLQRLRLWTEVRADCPLRT